MEHVMNASSSAGGAEMHHEMRDYGTFDGHIRPGLACAIYGLLWTYNNLFHYHAARKEAFLQGKATKKINYRSELFSKYNGSSWLVLAEPYGTFLVSLMGLVGETSITVFAGHPVTLAIDHLLMYVLYVLMSVCEIYRHRKYEMPPSTVHAIFMVANVAEGYLFLIHRHSGLSGQMHHSIAFLNFVTALCTACEIAYRSSIVAVLGRTLTFLAQGVYFLIMAFILYPISIIPKWEADEHVKMDVAASLLVVDIAFVLLIAVALNAIASSRVKSLNLATINCTGVFSRDIMYSSVSNEDNGKDPITDSEGGN